MDAHIESGSEDGGDNGYEMINFKGGSMILSITHGNTTYTGFSSPLFEPEDPSGCTAGAGSSLEEGTGLASGCSGTTDGARDEASTQMLEDAVRTITRIEEEAAEQQAAHEEELLVLRAHVEAREAATAEEQAAHEEELLVLRAHVEAREAATAEQQVAHEEELLALRAHAVAREEEAAEQQVAHEEELLALRAHAVAREAEAAEREAVLQAKVEILCEHETAREAAAAGRLAAREAAAAERQATREAELQLRARVAELETQLTSVRAANTVVTAEKEERVQEASLAGPAAAAGENGAGMQPEIEQVNIIGLDDGPLCQTSVPEVSLKIKVPPVPYGDDESDEGRGSPKTPTSLGSFVWAEGGGEWLLAETPDSAGDVDTGKKRLIWSVRKEDLAHVFQFVGDVDSFYTGRRLAAASLTTDAPVTSSGGEWDALLFWGKEGESLLAETQEGDGDVVLVLDEDLQRVFKFVDKAEAFVQTELDRQAAAKAAAAEEEEEEQQQQVERKVHFAEPLVTGEASPTSDASEELLAWRIERYFSEAVQEDAATTAPRVTAAPDRAPKPCEFGGRVRAASTAFTASPIRGTRAASVAVGAVMENERQTVRKQKVVSRLRRAAPRAAPPRVRAEPGRKPRWR